MCDLLAGVGRKCSRAWLIALIVAADCFDAEHDLVWATWEFTTAREGQTSLQRFADPGIRRRMVPLIRLMKEKDAEAAGHIEKALAAME